MDYNWKFCTKKNEKLENKSKKMMSHLGKFANDYTFYLVNKNFIPSWEITHPFAVLLFSHFCQCISKRWRIWSDWFKPISIERSTLERIITTVWYFITQNLTNNFTAHSICKWNAILDEHVCVLHNCHSYRFRYTHAHAHITPQCKHDSGLLWIWIVTIHLRFTPRSIENEW